jgi:hypothetical protein
MSVKKEPLAKSKKHQNQRKKRDGGEEGSHRPCQTRNGD